MTWKTLFYVFKFFFLKSSLEYAKFVSLCLFGCILKFQPALAINLFNEENEKERKLIDNPNAAICDYGLKF